MGSAFSLDEHGIFDQHLYDKYLTTKDENGNDYIPDLSGKVVAITGTSSGSLGYFVAKAAVAKKAKIVLLLNRELERSQKAENDVKEGADESTTVKTVKVDLQSLESVENASKEVNEIASDNGGLDVLCNNAGIMACKDIRTKDGFDVQMQTNQISHALLTMRCMPSLEMAAKNRGEARVVFHSSSARFGKPLELKYFEKCEEGSLGGDDAWETSQVMFGKEGPWMRYHQSKLANSAFAMALHYRLQEKGSKVKSMSCDPGWAHSNLQVTATKEGKMSTWSAKAGGSLGLAQSAADGSLSCAMACFNGNAASGDFFMPSSKGGMKGDPVKSIKLGKAVKKKGEAETTDSENQKLVWEACENALGFQFEL